MYTYVITHWFGCLTFVTHIKMLCMIFSFCFFSNHTFLQFPLSLQVYIYVTLCTTLYFAERLIWGRKWPIAVMRIGYVLLYFPCKICALYFCHSSKWRSGGPLRAILARGDAARLLRPAAKLFVNSSPGTPRPGPICHFPAASAATFHVFGVICLTPGPRATLTLGQIGKIPWFR